MTTIKIERRYPHPPKRVWRALTDRDAVSQWLMKTDEFEARVGAKFVLRAKPQPGWRGFVECEVVECEPEKVLAYTWVGNDEGPTMLVRFELAADGDGTKLRFEHSGFRGVGGWILARLMMGPGWKKMLGQRIPQVLERYAAGVEVGQGSVDTCSHALDA
jgi:uncharacterized protein YndB with AHSA1/START domain